MSSVNIMEMNFIPNLYHPEFARLFRCQIPDAVSSPGGHSCRSGSSGTGWGSEGVEGWGPSALFSLNVTEQESTAIRKYHNTKTRCAPTWNPFCLTRQTFIYKLLLMPQSYSVINYFMALPAISIFSTLS